MNLNESSVTRSEIERAISEKSVDFLDFGCSKGGSLKLGSTLFGGAKGLGIDIDPLKVEATIASENDAILADATDLQLPDGRVRFVLMLHFIEHLPGFALSKKAIQSAIRVSSEFVYIRHPWFDSDAQLFDMGLKFYWSDWRGHPNHFGKLAFFKVLANEERVLRWTLFGCHKVTNTNTRKLVGLGAPTDCFGADEIELSSRDHVDLPFSAYDEIACLIQIDPNLDREALVRKLKHHHVIYDSAKAKELR